MQFHSVSIGEIEDDIVNYFTHRFGTPPSALTPATDLKQMYKFNPTNWAQLADTLSNLPWMIHLGIRLAQGDMATVATVGQLAYLIFTKMQHVVVAPAPATHVTPVTALMSLSPHALPHSPNKPTVVAQPGSSKTGHKKGVASDKK
jgi:hypothetical protein